MQYKNSSKSYGLVSISLHWLVAITVFGLFGLGLWMTDLSYYSTWYHKAPSLHKSIGVILLLAMLVRVIWRFVSPPPAAIATHSAAVKLLSKLGHLALYAGIFIVLIAGYLISTAEGKGISVFGLFEVPALFAGSATQADVAGAVHLYVAWALVLAALGHGLAALKHHFIDKDATLKRMLGRGE